MRERHASQPASKRAERTVHEIYGLMNPTLVPGKKNKASPVGLHPVFSPPHRGLGVQMAREGCGEHQKKG